MAPAPRLRRILRDARRAGRRVLLFGIGNELLADDAVGFLIARDLTSSPNDPAPVDGGFLLPDAAVNRFQASGLISIPVGTALENAAGLVVTRAADVVFLVDAVRPPRRNARPWAFYDPDHLDAFIHSTHSVPMRLLVRWWREERPGIEVHFLGLRIAGIAPFDGMSPAVEASRREIVGIFRTILA